MVRECERLLESKSEKLKWYGDDMYTKSREEEVKLLKRLWTSQPTMCPRCGNAELVHLHKKAKKSNCEWKCPACEEVYRTIHMFKELPSE